VANPDRRLLELLRPILLGHAQLIEGILPPKLRSNWRQAVAFARPARGRKALDHRELLLEMAELDADAPRPPRELAAVVIARFPVAPGAGLEARDHVQLPDGSRPAWKDLMDRLARQYGNAKAALLQEVTETRRLVDRIRKEGNRLLSDGIRAGLPDAEQPRTPGGVARLRALGKAGGKPVVTAHKVDKVLKAFKALPRKP
jgi:hypothetical protein